MSQNEPQDHFVDVVMESDRFGMYKLAHRKCVDERDAIDTSGAVMPDRTPAHRGTICHRCGEKLEWQDENYDVLT